MNKLPLAALLSAVLVSGCSEDSNDTVPSPVVPPSPVKEYSTVDITPSAKFEGSITARLGRFNDKYKTWRFSGEATDVNNDGHIDEMDAKELNIINDLGPAIVIDAKEMDALLKTNPDGLGSGTARPDIFVTGHYSAFDVLRYVALTRDDIKLENVIDYRETGLDTYQFTISWDQNGDGIFDSQDSESFLSADWHFRIRFDGGELDRINSSIDGIGPEGEAQYLRMDKIWVQPSMSLRFQPFNPEMTARRKWVMNREMARFQQAGDKVIVPELVASFDGGKSYETLVTALEVTAHNIRPDIFQPGVITGIDTFLSAKDKGYDFVINYWPTISTKAPIDHFGLFRAAGKESVVGAGWSTSIGEKATQTDFIPLTDFSPKPLCHFGADGTPDGQPQVSEEVCFEDWTTYFGGNKIHMMTDVWVMSQPVEQVRLIYMDHYNIFRMKEFNGNTPSERDFSPTEDGSDNVTLRTLSIPASDNPDQPVLTESHFGWGIADCESCHNDKLPQGHGGYSWPVNSVDGFDEIQPYYCATCHGSNGAPLGHGETARCYWCHTEDKMQINHGEASSKEWIRGEENLEGNQHNYETQIKGHVFSVMPRDDAGNYAPYTEILSGINSDWNMSKSFPDPYSCMTCHPNSE